MIGWFCSKTRICRRVKFAVAADILKNDIIACSNWRIKMLLQNIWKNLLKYFIFLFVFLSFSFSHCVSSFNPPPPTVWWWGGGKRPRVSLWCLAAPYTLCILDILLMCVCIYVKCQIGCVQAQVWLCACWFGCGSITPQQSRRSPPQPSAVSRKVSRKTRREGCLSD